MKRIITILMLAVCTITLSAQDNKADKQWLKQGLWRNGFNGAKPHKSLNATEFHTQYTKNRQQWETLFQWLRDTDLQAIPKGKHPIPNSTLTASVEDSQNQPLSTGRYRSIVEFHAYIFNRWGQKLYEWTDISSGWDGTYNGSPVKDGVYYVLVNARGADGKVYNIRRDVNLIRNFNSVTNSTGGEE